MKKNKKKILLIILLLLPIFIASVSATWMILSKTVFAPRYNPNGNSILYKAFNNQNVDYNGNAQGPVSTDPLVDNANVSFSYRKAKSITAYTSGLPENAGEYDILIKDNKDVYIDDVVRFTINKATPEITAPTLDKDTIYEGESVGFSGGSATGVKGETISGSFSYTNSAGTAGLVYGDNTTNPFSTTVSFTFTSTNENYKTVEGINVQVTLLAVAYISGSPNKYYGKIETALSASSSGQTIYVIPGTTPSITSSCSIKSGVTLCMPYEGTTWDFGDPTTSLTDSFIDSNITYVNKYRVTYVSLIGSTLTIESGGNLYIGGKFRAKGICGSYTELALDDSSHIDVYGTLINYGYIKEIYGKNPYQSDYDDVAEKYDNEIDQNRYIEVFSGAFLKNALAVYNSLGASYLSGLNDLGICPVDTFDFPNAQTYIKINAGATIQAQAKILVTASSATQAVNETATIISNQTYATNYSLKPLFYLESGYMSIENCPENVLYSNVNSKTIININGTINVGYLYINLKAAEINTSNMFLPIGYKFKIFIKSGGILTSDYKIKFLPGATLYVESQALANLNSDTIFYKAGALDDISNTYPKSQSDAVCINDGSIILGSSSHFGGHVSTNSGDGTALIDTTKISSSNLTATSNEGNANVVIKVESTGDFYIDETDSIETKLIASGQSIYSRNDGKLCWANGFVNTYKLIVNVVNTNGYTYPAIAFKVFGYDSSGGNEVLMSSQGRYEMDLGTYEYYFEPNQQFKIYEFDRADNITFTSQNGSSYSFTNGTKYNILGDIEVTIVAGEGIQMWFTSTGKSGNGGSTKTIYESSTQNGTFEELITAGESGATVKFVIGKNKYFKYKYTKGTGLASVKGIYKFTGHTETNTTTTGATLVSAKNSSTSNAILADAEYSLLAYMEDSTCLIEGTLITMGDGTQKKIEDIKTGDYVKVFNHETGTIDTSFIVVNVHENTEQVKTTIMNLMFDNGQRTRISFEHGFFDIDLNEYVYINMDNYLSMIGHRFYMLDGSIITLTDVYITEEYVKVFSPVTYKHLNIFSDNLLSVGGDLRGLFNIFELDDEMKIDIDKMNADIEKYGLYTYEEWSEYLTYEQFVAFNVKYLKVSIGKGLVTKEEIMRYIYSYL